MTSSPNSRKRRVAILLGGRSSEHEVSLNSARNVLNALDPNRYEVIAIGLDQQGRWQQLDIPRFLSSDATYIETSSTNVLPHLKSIPAESALALLPGDNLPNWIDTHQPANHLSHIDVVFPVLHGPYGEDGAMQGLLKMANLPFVGADVLGSAVGMDKDVMKRLFKMADIPITDFLVFRAHERANIKYAEIVKQLGEPFFVKPANLGSSVGIHKVHAEPEFQAALDDAFKYDSKIILERTVIGREIECAVLGNQEKREVSLPGELIPQDEFYSYHAKYIMEDGALFNIPASLPKHIIEKIQALSIKATDVLCCEGMARVDFFLTPDEQLIVNEINTIPGFTNISMYHALWQASGLSYSALLDRLIDLAIERFNRDKKLRT